MYGFAPTGEKSTRPESISATTRKGREKEVMPAGSWQLLTSVYRRYRLQICVVIGRDPWIIWVSSTDLKTGHSRVSLAPALITYPVVDHE